MLTHRQRDCLQFIIGYQRENDGVSPSLDEVAEGLDLASKSGVNRLLNALEERRYISRVKHRSRAIQVLRPPGECQIGSRRNARALADLIMAEDSPTLRRDRLVQIIEGSGLI